MRDLLVFLYLKILDLCTLLSFELMQRKFPSHIPRPEIRMIKNKVTNFRDSGWEEPKINILFWRDIKVDVRTVVHVLLFTTMMNFKPTFKWLKEFAILNVSNKVNLLKPKVGNLIEWELIPELEKAKNHELFFVKLLKDAYGPLAFDSIITEHTMNVQSLPFHHLNGLNEFTNFKIPKRVMWRERNKIIELLKQ